MNKNQYSNWGDLYSTYLLGKCSEFCKTGDLFEYLREIVQSELPRDYELSVKDVVDWQTTKFQSIWAFRFFRIVIYALVRDLNPFLVVETGVLHGMTSGFILEALEINNQGRLFSCDLPSLDLSNPANQDGYYSALPKDRQPGWLVPERLRNRWDLSIGPSHDILNASKAKLENIDIFCHDSEHSYRNMWSELTFGWERLVSGGILICDNTEANPSFFDFCRKIDRIPLVLPTPNQDVSYAPRFGILVK